jgi:antitoxin VapB
MMFPEVMSVYYEAIVMACVKTRIFKSNRSQAVRLPVDVASPESVKDVKITAIGNKRLIAPAGQSWEDWFSASGVSSDFMTERNQPEDQGDLAGRTMQPY